MSTKKGMNEDELKAFLDQEEKEAVGYAWGQLSREREAAMDYYFAEQFGDEPAPEENRSRIVSTDVQDSVEWLLPCLIRIFASTDKAVEFEAQNAEDEEGAKQATATGNYVFWRQNPGFLILYSWFKDALIQKNGAIKWWWDKSVSKKREKYAGVNMDELTMMMQNDPDKFTIISKSEPYPDEQGTALLMQQYQQVTQAAQAQGQPVPPPPQPLMLYDVELEISEEAGKVCIEPIPPEELLVSRRHNSILLDRCPYVAHIGKHTLSELRDMGYEISDADEQEVLADSATFLDYSPERLARESKNENGAVMPLRTDSTDPSQRQVWLREAYVLVDTDGDGIAERRRIVRAGNKIFENDITDHIQIAAITPNIITHRFYGMSIAELVMDLQKLTSTLWRQMVDNLVAANNQGHIVLASADGRVQANIDDLLTSRPNRVIREYAPNAVRTEATPWVAGQTFPMLEYIDQQRQNRTGANPMSQGLDADALNKTATGANLAQNQMQEKVELIARIFAEVGMKPLFKGIQCMLAKYSTKPMTYRLLNKYVSVDPREWKTSYDMIVNVGIGTGNKDQQLAHLSAISHAQQAAAAAGGMGLLITPKNIYNVQAKIVENAGFKNVAEFWKDPGDAMPQPQTPQSDPVKMRELDIKQQEADTNKANMQTDQFRAQTERNKANADLQLKAGMALAENSQWDKDRSVEAAKTLASLDQGRQQANQDAAQPAANAEKPENAENGTHDILKSIAHSQIQLAHHLAQPKPLMRRVVVRHPQTKQIMHVDEVPIN